MRFAIHRTAAKRVRCFFDIFYFWEDTMSKYFFTSESVTEGHPDKVCDKISDSILDAILAQDPKAHVACEVTATTGIINVMGEISTECYVDIPSLVRDVIKEIGYDDPACGFDGNTCAVTTSIDVQSPDIAMGVNESYESRHGATDENDKIGAGDQGMMFGFACDETPEFMPLAISLAHKLAKQLTKVRKDGTLSYLRPDGKTQVTIEYDDDKAVRVDTIVLSTQHDPNVAHVTLCDDILKHVIKPIIPENLLDDKTKYFINPTGNFVIGGPVGDTGLTGRKIIIDTYGGYGRHGGGAFSGKDPSKVDRSAAYAARHIAKNLVAAGVADEVLVQVSYAIGVARPINIYVNTYGRSNVALTDGKIAKKVDEIFDMRPRAIEERLKLRNPIYSETAAYGHMGREPQIVTKHFESAYEGNKDVEVELFTWEKLDYVDKVKEAFGLK